MIKIAVDAMGSDHAPGVEVEGAVQVASQLGVPIVLVGQESLVRPLLAKHDAADLPIEIVHASEAVTMEDSATAAVRRKKDSSIRVAETLMRDGKVSGVVSAGNTGAGMATAKFGVGTLPVVDRPALSTVLPTQKGKPAILLDVGANVDCKPLHLEQFAIMGDIYSRAIFGIRRPRVGLLSIGEEDSKGNELTKEAFKSLRQAPINFIGNVEGRDIFKGDGEDETQQDHASPEDHFHLAKEKKTDRFFSLLCGPVSPRKEKIKDDSFNHHQNLFPTHQDFHRASVM